MRDDSPLATPGRFTVTRRGVSATPSPRVNHRARGRVDQLHKCPGQRGGMSADPGPWLAAGIRPGRAVGSRQPVAPGPAPPKARPGAFNQIHPCTPPIVWIFVSASWRSQGAGLRRCLGGPAGIWTGRCRRWCAILRIDQPVRSLPSELLASAANTTLAGSMLAGQHQVQEHRVAARARPGPVRGRPPGPSPNGPPFGRRRPAAGLARQPPPRRPDQRRMV